MSNRDKKREWRDKETLNERVERFVLPLERYHWTALYDLDCIKVSCRLTFSRGYEEWYVSIQVCDADDTYRCRGQIVKDYEEAKQIYDRFLSLVLTAPNPLPVEWCNINGLNQ